MKTSDKIARAFTFLSALFLAFVLGLASGRYQWAPTNILATAESGWLELSNARERPWYFCELEPPYPEPITNSGTAYPGVNLVTRIAIDPEIVAEVIDLDGNVIQRWDVNWHRIWPDPEHLPAHVRPKGKFDTHIHGAAILPNGDLVFNYEHLGLVRLNKDSEIVWRLSYQTHHSVQVHDDGNLWVCGQRERFETNPVFPHRPVPHDEYTIIEVSPAGEIVNEWFLSELLSEGGYDGLYYLTSELYHPSLRNDLVHLNDVEPFPDTMAEGFYRRGDVAVSLRHVNTVFVFNRFDRSIRSIWTGRTINQHDPDFVDSDRISIYDNNPRTTDLDAVHRSRIVILSGSGGAEQVAFEGSPEHPFYSRIMGKHQWLPNGGLLIVESTKGRAFELDAAGNIVWEFVNFVDDGIVGLIEQVERLPESYANLY